MPDEARLLYLLMVAAVVAPGRPRRPAPPAAQARQVAQKARRPPRQTKAPTSLPTFKDAAALGEGRVHGGAQLAPAPPARRPIPGRLDVM